METEFGAAPNSDAEKKALALFERLEDAEVGRDKVGMEFGRAVIELRDEIRESGDRDFLARLKQLGISQPKARYWIDKVEGRNPNRHKAAEPKAQEKPAFNWDAAVARLEDLKDDVHIFMKSEPVGAGRLVGPLASLAELLGYELKAKGGSNA